MGKVDIDFIIKENAILMQQIKANREKFWQKLAVKLQKKNK
jgi:hypothetical protein